MNLQKQEGCTCTLTSLAMVLDVPYAKLVADFGYDGQEMITNKVPPPFCFKGVTIHEVIDYCEKLGRVTIMVVANPVLVVGDETIQVYVDPESRLRRYMDRYCGLIVGETVSGMGHCCAWDRKMVFDPHGVIYPLDDLRINLNLFLAII
jgi:hypothetical protein